MIILINTGECLSTAEMEELQRRCEATTWFQVLMPDVPDIETQDELADWVLTVVTEGTLLSQKNLE